MLANTSQLPLPQVCIIDATVCVFVWVGQGVFEEDEVVAMNLAHG